MTGRIDIFVERLLELAAGRAEQKFNIPGLAEAAKPEIKRAVSSIRGSKLSPLMLAILRKVADEYVAKSFPERES